MQVCYLCIMSIVIVNTKAYQEGIGKRAISLAQIMEKIGEEYCVNMAIAVQPSDVYMVSSEVNIPVFSQHIDPISFGSNTGWILPQAVKEAGAKGTLLNHSEHRMDTEDIAKTIKVAHATGLTTVACSSNIPVTRTIASFEPLYVAIEPPELIGGNISVTQAQPEIVRGAVQEALDVNPKVLVLCGAGIKNGDDVSKALELGAEGILVASGVVNALDKRSVLEDMARAMI